MADELIIAPAAWPRDQASLRAVRDAVFIDEQAVPPALAWDDRDAQAVHVLAWRGGRPVGCGRLLADGRIGRMAVLREERGRGIGAALLGALLDAARRAGRLEVYLHAQRRACAFYERQGFAAEGGAFIEADIEHLAMRLPVSYRHCAVPVAPVRYPAPFAELLGTLAATARRRLSVLSPGLDPITFGSAELVSSLVALCRQGRDAEVRLLVADARALTARGHRLLELARRLPSCVSLRQLEEHPQWPGDTCIVRDRDGVLWHAADSPQAGRYAPSDRARAARELERFDQLWVQGTVPADFRALNL